MDDKTNVAAAMGCACAKDDAPESAALWLLILAILSMGGGANAPKRDLSAEQISYLSGKVDALEELLYGRKREAGHGNH